MRVKKCIKMPIKRSNYLFVDLKRQRLITLPFFDKKKKKKQRRISDGESVKEFRSIGVTA